MKLSARNCLQGKVVAIKNGPVSTEVTIETAAGEPAFSLPQEQKNDTAIHIRKKSYIFQKFLVECLIFNHGYHSMFLIRI